MSLLWRRGAIERAVAGLLATPDEQSLRAHLARCPRCRDHYDQLSVTARALRDAPEQATPGQITRERQRLALALTGKSPIRAERPAPPVSRRWVLTLSPVLVAAVLIVAMRVRSADQAVRSRMVATDEVRWRGPREGTSGAPLASLLVYAAAKRPAGERRVRMVAEFPGSHEGTVGRDEYIQFTVRHELPRAFVTLLGLDARGTLHRYFPRPGIAAGPQLPGGAAVSLGPSLDLGSSHPTGPLRLLALFSEQPLDEGRLREALAAAPPPDAHGWSLALPGHQVTGMLLVRP